LPRGISRRGLPARVRSEFSSARRLGNPRGQSKTGVIRDSRSRTEDRRFGEYRRDDPVAGPKVVAFTRHRRQQTPLHKAHDFFWAACGLPEGTKFYQNASYPRSSCSLWLSHNTHPPGFSRRSSLVRARRILPDCSDNIVLDHTGMPPADVSRRLSAARASPMFVECGAGIFRVCGLPRNRRCHRLPSSPDNLATQSAALLSRFPLSPKQCSLIDHLQRPPFNLVLLIRQPRGVSHHHPRGFIPGKMT